MTVTPGNTVPPATTGAGADWLRALRRYMVFSAAANTVWEFAHMPLYTLWDTGTYSEIVFAALHCAGGDVLIALSAIMLALFACGNEAWPGGRNRRVIFVTVILGLCYTVFSEWLNIEIRAAWAYNDKMPVIPFLESGLSPVLQWIVIPLAAFRWANPRRFRPARRTAANA